MYSADESIYSFLGSANSQKEIDLRYTHDCSKCVKHGMEHTVNVLKYVWSGLRRTGFIMEFTVNVTSSITNVLAHTITEQESTAYVLEYTELELKSKVT